MANKTILILYTTIYRSGGPKFERAAITMEKEKRAEFPDYEIIRKPVERKAAFAEELSSVGRRGREIEELHFIGHSGVYGIMFGTTAWPEQFSPHEWKSMQIPFAKNARAYFHACRTGRWFAPFFANNFQIRTFGHHWYTTVSLAKNRFVPEHPLAKSADIYLIASTGRKSHGLLGSIQKYFGFAKAFPLLEFSPTKEKVDASYDSVAALYDETFSDIGVRQDEWTWLMRNGQALEGKKVLDIGCGNGAFLSKLSPLISSGVGVDISAGMLEKARERCQSLPNIQFAKLDGPKLPFPDNSFDTVMSVLAFRYLDWDPIMKEILRVLKPGGEVLIMDMVAAPVKWQELPKFTIDKAKQIRQRITQKNYIQALAKMVSDQRWKKMLQYNPIRAEHELRWYLESRLPGRKVETVNVGWSSRILAFRSGPVQTKEIQEMQFP